MKTRRNNNEGSLFQVKNGAKAGFWVAKVCIGYNEKGKPIIKQVQRREKADAQKALREMLADLNKGTFLKPNNMLFCDWLDTYMEIYKKQNVSLSTYTKLLGIAKYIKRSPLLASLALQKVNAHLLQTFISTVKKKDGTALAPKTIRELVSLLSMMLNQALKNEYLKKNYAKDIEIPKITQKETKPLSLDELGKLLEATKGHRLYHALLLLVSTGMRKGELLGLKWSDIDFTTGVISINHSYSMAAGKPVLGSTKTDRSKREITVPRIVLFELKEAYDRSDKNVPWVVTSSYARYKDTITPVSPNNFRRLFAKWCQKAGIEKHTVHSTRHTFASLSINECGADVKLLQETLGHTNARTTLNIYTHLDKRRKNDLADGFNKLLSNIM